MLCRKPLSSINKTFIDLEIIVHAFSCMYASVNISPMPKIWINKSMPVYSNI